MTRFVGLFFLGHHVYCIPCRLIVKYRKESTQRVGWANSQSPSLGSPYSKDIAKLSKVYYLTFCHYAEGTAIRLKGRHPLRDWNSKLSEISFVSGTEMYHLWVFVTLWVYYQIIRGGVLWMVFREIFCKITRKMVASFPAHCLKFYHGFWIVTIFSYRIVGTCSIIRLSSPIFQQFDNFSFKLFFTAFATVFDNRFYQISRLVLLI